MRELKLESHLIKKVSYRAVGESDRGKGRKQIVVSNLVVQSIHDFLSFLFFCFLSVVMGGYDDEVHTWDTFNCTELQNFAHFVTLFVGFRRPCP